MGSVNYYRTEAQRCRDLAANAPESAMARRWLTLAAEYETLAEAREASPGAMPVQAQTQRQPMQQQQQKKTEDEK